MGAMAMVVIGGMAMWLLKGPAVLGAWVGVAVASNWRGGRVQSWGRGWKGFFRSLFRAKLWLPIVLGVVGFGVWATLVWMRMSSASDGAVDTTGMNEVSGYMGGSGLARYGRAIGAALLSPTYALPACLLAIPVILGLRRGTWEERERRLLIGLLAAFVAGALVSLVVGLRQPRYYYTLLVMVPMFAAAVAGRWEAMVGGDKGREAVRAGMSVFAIVLAVGSGVLAKTSTGAHDMSWPWITAGLAIAASIWALVELVRHRAGWGLVALSLTLLATMSTFGGRWLSDKHDKGVLAASAQLRETVADAPAVYATKTVFDHPEMYHHSGVWPTKLPADWLTLGHSLRPGAWCVLQDYEWELIRDREDIGRWQPQEIVLDGDTMWMVRVP
ncbi:hypothetical protein [Algisphaera agarilytica]|nr:hypothetical protein [Algisphaera agarilytica]